LSAAQAHAHNYGGDLVVYWNVTHRWRISPSYSFLQMHVAGDPFSEGPAAGGIAGDTPKHQFQAHCRFVLHRKLERGPGCAELFPARHAARSVFAKIASGFDARSA
jgi:hypothetical protein